MSNDDNTGTPERDDVGSMELTQIAAELRQLLDGTPEGEWIWTRDRFETTEQLLAWMYSTVVDGESPDVFGVRIRDGAQVAVCGNGEHARRYARLIMLSRACLPFIADLLERADSQ